MKAVVALAVPTLLAATLAAAPTATADTSPGLSPAAAKQIHDALARQGVSEANIAKVLRHPKAADNVVVKWSSSGKVTPAKAPARVASAASGAYRCWDGYVRKNGNNHFGVTMVWFRMDTEWCSYNRNHHEFNRSSSYKYGTPGVVWNWDGQGPGFSKWTHHHRKWSRERSGNFSFPLAWFTQQVTLWTYADMWGDGTFNWSTDET